MGVGETSPVTITEVNLLLLQVRVTKTLFFPKVQTFHSFIFFRVAVYRPQIQPTLLVYRVIPKDKQFPGRIMNPR